MEEIKTMKFTERQAYVPASVKVMEVTVRKVLCTSDTYFNDEGDQIQ